MYFDICLHSFSYSLVYFCILLITLAPSPFLAPSPLLAPSLYPSPAPAAFLELYSSDSREIYVYRVEGAYTGSQYVYAIIVC